MADTGIVEVAGLIERQKFGGFQLKLLLLGMAVLILDGFDAQIMGYVAPACLTLGISARARWRRSSPPACSV